MANISKKVLCVNRIGWKRIAKNQMRFGWTLSDAEQETTITQERSYTGTIINDKIKLEEHVTETSKIRVWLSFWRNRDNFTNLSAIAPIEAVYNLVFLVRRILGFILPVALLAILGLAIFTFQELAITIGNLTLIGFGIWLGGIILEEVLSRVANAILKRD